MIKGSNQQENITSVTIYIPNIGASYIHKGNVNRKREKLTVIKVVQDFNTLLTSMNRSFRQSINKETMTLYNT